MGPECHPNSLLAIRIVRRGAPSDLPARSRLRSFLSRNRPTDGCRKPPCLSPFPYILSRGSGVGSGGSRGAARSGEAGLTSPRSPQASERGDLGRLAAYRGFRKERVLAVARGPGSPRTSDGDEINARRPVRRDVVESRRLAAIAFTDLVGFTSAVQADEGAALDRLREVERLIRPIVAAYGGREIKSTGDGLLLEFASATKAVEWAIEVQGMLRTYYLERNGRAFQMRVGVHVGDVEEREGDVFGDTVNLASRIVREAEPGGVCVSQQVADHVRTRLPHVLERLGPRSLKGVQEPVDLYRVRPPSKEHTGGDGEPKTPRLAVLPLANISPDPKDEYFADGLTEELIAVLSQIEGLKVIARTSVSRYKSATKSIPEIAADLGVSSVLEGSVRKAGNRIRITLQLIDARSQEHVWANSYNRELDDVFAIQMDIAEQTAGALRLQLVGPSRAAIERRPTANVQAYDLYLKGIHAVHDVSSGGFHEALRCFEAATRLDPSFAAAFSHWANTYAAALGEWITRREGYPRAKELVEKALRLDPDSSEAHMAAGNIALQCELDWSRAESEFRRATELNPNNSEAHEWYGILLLTLQRFGEARDEFERSRQADPSWKSPISWLATTALCAGDLETAAAMVKRSCELEGPSVMDRMRMALVHLKAGRKAEARDELERAGPPGPGQARYYGAIVFARLGRTEEAERMVREAEEGTEPAYLSDGRRAGLYAALGQSERALDLLEHDYREGDRILWFEYQYPPFDLLWAHPRFRALLREYRLPDVKEGAAPPT